jgi:hypothetical protein
MRLKDDYKPLELKLIPEALLSTNFSLVTPPN